jgi:2-hydroxychromene-2-carboxylate isomerase
MDRAIVEVFFALGSRYSYLAFTQLPRIERETGCRFALHPISSAELYALRGVSPFAGPPASGQYDWGYRERDAEMWAEHYRVPFVEPQPMPEDHRLMPRACRAAERQEALAGFCNALFRAVYAEHREIDLAECAAVGAAIGLDPGRLLSDIDSPEIERQVTADADQASRRGAFGVPTFFLDDRLYWGNDRLVLLEAHLQRRARG